MEINDVINNVEIFGFESSIRGSKYPMAVDLEKLNDDISQRTYTLANATIGSGHDNFLNGIICLLYTSPSPRD